MFRVLRARRSATVMNMAQYALASIELARCCLYCAGASADIVAPSLLRGAIRDGSELCCS